MDSQTKRCPQCAEEIKAEAILCRFCGARFIVAVRGYCSNCGDKVDLDENGKCSRCGGEIIDRHIESRLAEQAVSPPPPPAAPAAKPQPANFPAHPGQHKRPSSSASGWILRICLLTAGVIIICVVLDSLGAFASSAPTPEPTATFTDLPTATPNPTDTPAPTSTPLPVEVDFETLENYPEGTLVSLAGRLARITSTRCGYSCSLRLENPDNTSQHFTIFVVEANKGDDPAPGQMKYLPMIYSISDIQVRLADGSYAGVGDRIVVTGRVCKTDSGESCIDSILKIESG